MTSVNQKYYSVYDKTYDITHIVCNQNSSKNFV